MDQVISEEQRLPTPLFVKVDSVKFFLNWDDSESKEYQDTKKKEKSLRTRSWMMELLEKTCSNIVDN